MESFENKINNFINMMFLWSPQILSAGEIDAEYDIFTAVTQFKKKMLVLQLGINTVVQDTFIRYFNCVNLNLERVKSVAMRHCFGAYDNFPVFFALMYSCSFLTIISDCCETNQLPDFKEQVPWLSRRIFAFMTGSSYSPEDWKNLLEFSVAYNLPKVISLVRLCVTGATKLFWIQKLDRDCAIFGICDVSALERFQNYDLEGYNCFFTEVFREEFRQNPAYLPQVDYVWREFKASLLMKISALRAS